MSNKATGQQSETQRDSRKSEQDVLPAIPLDRRDEEFEEPGAFGESVAEKMLAIARQYFPPVSAEKHE